MELQHSFTVPTSVDEAWDLFMDLGRVGGCFPGATITDVSGDNFTGTVKVRLGPIALLYAGSGTFLEKDESARRAVIEAKGKDKRGNGTAGATVTIQLAENGAGTRADVKTDLAVTGKPAQFGRGVMQDVSDKLLGQFVTCIEQQFAPAAAAPAEGAGAPEAADTTEAAGAPAAKRAPAKKAAAKRAPAKKAAATKAPAKAAPAAKKAGEAPAAEAVVAEAPATKAATKATAARQATASSPHPILPTVELGDTEVDDGAIAVTEQQSGGSDGVPTPSAATSPATLAGGRTTTASPATYKPVEDDAIDLGATLLPVLARRYAGYAVAGLLGLVIGWLLGRRRPAK